MGNELLIIAILFGGMMGSAFNEYVKFASTVLYQMLGIPTGVSVVLMLASFAAGFVCYGRKKLED